MKIAVVIPTFNSENTILQTVESAIDQTFQPNEIIVVDDCSTDKTIEKIEKYITRKKTDIIRIINTEHNKGPSTCRNIGWNSCNGDFVAFLDSDDLWHIQKLEIVKSILERDETIDLVGHAYSINKRFTSHYLVKDIANKDLKKVSFKSLLLRNCLQSSCVLVRRNIKERFNEKMRYNEDHELWARLALTHKVYYLDFELTALSRPVLTSGGLSENTLRMRLGEIRMYLNLARQCKIMLLATPLLVIFSFGKHIRRIVKQKRSGNNETG
ncbi:MAG: glycosyltransferase family 2 protein [Candidatus Hodarchaeota archaeon]